MSLKEPAHLTWDDRLADDDKQLVGALNFNYFAPIGGSYGPTAERQFDGLADLGEALSETPTNSKEG